QARTTTEVPIINEHVVNNNTKTRGNNQRQISFSDFEKEEENDNEKSPSLNKDKRKCKSYLQTFKILAYLKDRVNKDNKIKLDFKDVFNEVCEYAKNTIETYDSWVCNHYEAQVWQHIYDLGKEKDHWAKEVVNTTYTREAKINVSMCEKKLAQLTTTCFDADNIITRNMRELSSKTATVATQRVHDLILDYVKEATQGLAKISINRIRRASIEKDERDALKTFENVASEQQKMYAKTFCKPALINYHKKKKNFELVAAHISYDIIPKILPQYDFNLPVDENSLTSEQTQEYRKSINNLSKDFRLKATELYLKIVKEEYEFQKERLQKLIDDFPQDRYEVPSTQIDTNIVVDDEDDDEEPLENGVFTQKPLSKRQETINNQKATQTVIRKTDKSKVFHLGKLDDYKVKAQTYMINTKAYQDLGTVNPLESLVERTNNFLYGLWVNKHITQKQYENFKVGKDEAELAHLYFLPKAHKPGTPLRPIMSGLKSPTIEISRWLDSLLRPLFDRLTINTTVKNGLQLIQQVERWSATYLTRATSFVTMDVTDLYTMIPQEGGVTAIKKLMEASGLKQIDGVKKEIQGNGFFHSNPGQAILQWYIPLHHFKGRKI
ncbi:unnamed protein product, partial [Rotaria sordida]